MKTTKIVFLSMLLTLFFGSIAIAGDSALPAGYIGDIEGTVTIERKANPGTQEAARVGMQLYAGDAVNTREDAKAILILNGQTEKTTVNANRSYSVQGDSEAKGWFSGLVDAIFSLTDDDATSNYTTVLMVRGEDSIERMLEVTPNVTALLESRPNFRWTAINSADRYVVKLMDWEETIIWRLESGQSILDYPRAEQALDYGNEYFLQVTAYQGEKLITTGIANFRILEKEHHSDVKRMESEYQEAPFILASGYASLELYDLATAKIREIIETDMDNKHLNKMLANIYLKQGKVSEARALLAQQ